MEHATVTPVITSRYKQENTSGKRVYMQSIISGMRILDLMNLLSSILRSMRLIQVK